jgi:hypothetical protein
MNDYNRIVPQGQHFINRRLQPTDMKTYPLYQVPQGRHIVAECRPCRAKRRGRFFFRRLKPTVNKVLSLRDFTIEYLTRTNYNIFLE